MDLANDKKFYSLLVSFTWYSIRILFLCFLIFGCDHSLNSEKKESGSDDIPVPDPLYLDVEYPNGGEIFDPGSIVPIQWVSNLDTCEWGMRIVLYKGINEEELVHVNTPNTGIFQWYVNTELASGGSYRIWIESLCDKGVYCGGCFGDLFVEYLFPSSQRDELLNEVSIKTLLNDSFFFMLKTNLLVSGE